MEKGISLGEGNGCFFMAVQAFLMVTKYAIVRGHGDEFFGDAFVMSGEGVKRFRLDGKGG